MKKGILGLILISAISASAAVTFGNNGIINPSADLNLSSSTNVNTNVTNGLNSAKTVSGSNNNSTSGVKFNLVVTKAGTGNGRIESPQLNVEFGQILKMNKGTKVTLKAVPTEGSKFNGWSGACLGVKSDTCTISANKSKKVIVSFKTEVSALTNTEFRSADSSCAATAITKRDNAIVTSMVEQNQKLIDSINARKNAQILAFQKTGDERIKALRAVTASTTKTQESINNKLKDSRGAAISVFKLEMKACGYENDETETN